MEVLAPAGNRQCFESALNHGADAVYLALTRFGARANAENFSQEDLPHIIERAHLFNVKVYLTFNTLIKNNELDEAVALVKSAWQMGADAVIVQDYGLIQRLKQEVPDIVLHASTQMGVHNAQGAAALEKMGFTRVILSREATLKDIEKIKRETSLEVEMFVQGALCVSFSGNCYFSSLVSGYSGNRGKCLQLCRKQYLYEGQRAYHLSTKDLCLYSMIERLKQAGVDSLKIEGRMRRPEYVAAACMAYRNIADGKFDGEDIERLKRVYNRGDYCGAYILPNKAGVICNTAQGHIGVKKGQVKKVVGAVAYLDCKVSAGDGIKFLRKGFETGGASIESNGNTTGFSGDVKAGDEVRLTTDCKLNKSFFTGEKYLEASAEIKLFVGQKPQVTCEYHSLKVDFTYDFILPPAKTSFVTIEEITSSFEKKGDGSIAFHVKNVQLDSAIFIPKAVQNDIRREAVKRLKASILAQYNSNRQQFKGVSATLSDIVLQKPPLKPSFTMLEVDSIKAVTKRMLGLVDCIALKPAVYDEGICQDIESLSIPVFLSLPPIARERDIDILQNIVVQNKFYGYIVNNPYGLELCKGQNVILGSGLNLLNDEINLVKIKSIESERFSDGDICYVYGKLALMTLTHCPRLESGKSCSDCDGKDKIIKDEKGNTFRLRRIKMHYCYHQLLNCKPLNLTDKRIARKIIDGTDCGEDELIKALEGASNGDFTRGNFEKVLY